MDGQLEGVACVCTQSARLCVCIHTKMGVHASGLTSFLHLWQRWLLSGHLVVSTD
jgi:hypothetical protein